MNTGKCYKSRARRPTTSSSSVCTSEARLTVKRVVSPVALREEAGNELVAYREDATPLKIKAEAKG